MQVITVIFLGAGASTVFGIKTLQEISDDLLDYMNENGYCDLVKQIEQSLGRFNMTIDFENLYTIAEAIVDPKSAVLDAGPFAAYVSKDISDFKNNRSSVELLKHFRSFIYGECKFKKHYYEKLSVYDSLLNLANSLVGGREERYLCSMEGPKGDVGIGDTIVTTNYNVSSEIYHRRDQTRKKCIDGFRNSVNDPFRSVLDIMTYHDDPQGRWLIKLHGSIWRYSDGNKIFKTIEDPKGSSLPIDIEEDMLIFPTKEKHILKSPYYEFYHLFRIQKWKTLISIGYSFRDEAVNIAVLENLKRDIESILIVINPNALKVLKNLSTDFSPELTERIIPINAKFGENTWFEQLSFALRCRNRSRFVERISKKGLLS